MNVEIRIEAAQFLFWEHKNPNFSAVWFEGGKGCLEDLFEDRTWENIIIIENIDRSQTHECGN
jgi:hypothetical protein